MVLWVGLDDTDSTHGMCTTFLATEVLKELTKDYDLIGYPRLVRLNPNIPWKTRGNGSVSFRIGRGLGPGRRVGELEGTPLISYERGARTGDSGGVLATITELVERWAVLEDPMTNPGAVVLERRPPPSLYWRVVRDLVAIDDVVRMLPKLGAFRGYKNQRGLIGAAAAVAWRPRDRTYELLAYRSRARWGSPRVLLASSVEAMDRAFPSTFNSIDPESGRIAIAPHSPCPVLYGIRGNDGSDLIPALEMLEGEAPSRFMVVESNQATDDHVVFNDWSLRPYSSTSVAVVVTERAVTIRGGHVLVRARGAREVDLAFYEPSKDFRRVARALWPGDRLRVWGSVRQGGRSLNVEKMHIDETTIARVRIGNPLCLTCGKAMKSVGRGKGFRCLRGDGRAPREAGIWVELPREVRPGWYEPPAFARRHLCMPARRIQARSINEFLPSAQSELPGASLD
jgi:tRNA(Ile2)-agmatinylcytidine synthase